MGAVEDIDIARAGAIEIDCHPGDEGNVTSDDSYRSAGSSAGWIGDYAGRPAYRRSNRIAEARTGGDGAARGCQCDRYVGDGTRAQVGHGCGDGGSAHHVNAAAGGAVEADRGA